MAAMRPAVACWGAPMVGLAMSPAAAIVTLDAWTTGTPCNITSAIAPMRKHRFKVETRSMTAPDSAD